MLIGLGKQVKKVVPQGPYTVSFSIYDVNLPATQTGNPEPISDKMAGETFIIPTQGNMVRTEQTYSSPPGGGNIIIGTINIPLYAWSDGNGLYFPGETYTMPNSDITLSAIWLTEYSPSISTMDPFYVSHGDTITITGFALGATEEVEFNRNFVAEFTIISDYEIRVVVPPSATGTDENPGRLTIVTISGGVASRFDGYQII